MFEIQIYQQDVFVLMWLNTNYFEGSRCYGYGKDHNKMPKIYQYNVNHV